MRASSPVLSQKGLDMTIAGNTMNASMLMTRMGELIDQGRPAAARPLLAAVRSLASPSMGFDPENASRLALLAARLALSEGALDDAEAELDAALITEPCHPGLRKCRAEVRRLLGDTEGAARDAAEAVILDRHDPGAKAILGMLMLDLGRSEEAAACLAEAVRAMPHEAGFREALANARIAAGDMDGALAALLEGIVLTPGATATRNAAILLCIRRRDFARAERLAEQSRADGVADACTFGLKGHALSSLARHDEAALAYDEALKLGPDDAYVRHLAAAAGIAPTVPRAPGAYVKALFDGYAERFESHIIALGYRIPGLIRRHVTDFAATTAIGPVLDLGCGTGLMAVALFDLPLGPLTGIDLSPAMLDQAREKELYAELRQAELPAALREDTARWTLIVAADLMCYFGALEDMLDAIRDRLAPGGRCIFSVEELLPDHDGVIPGDNTWSLGRQGRYAHAASYVARAAEDRGFRVLTLDPETLRHEAGGPVAGLLVVLERPRDDA